MTFYEFLSRNPDFAKGLLFLGFALVIALGLALHKFAESWGKRK